MPLHEDVIVRLRHIVGAVERQFTIGEVLRAAVRLDEAIASSITHVRAIIAFRHVLIHGYSQ